MALGCRGACTTDVAKTKVLIGCAVAVQLICIFDSAYAESSFSHDTAHLTFQPGGKAWLVAMLLGNQEATCLILASGTSFREDLVMKIFLRHSSSSADSRRGFVS